MGVVGIVSEYNPFHRGHAWHLQAALEKSGCAGAVCAMSGSFTQRGQPALLPKWLRARMAVACGAQLVVELPCACLLYTSNRSCSASSAMVDSPLVAKKGPAHSLSLIHI